MGAILLNTVTFAVSSSLKPTADNMIYLNILDGIDSTFLSLYCLEFLIKIHSFGRSYWFNGFNCFDFSVLICSLFQIVLSHTVNKNWGVIKVMRSLRALRPLRSISLIGGLQVVVTALIATLTGSFIHIILLLTVLMFVYGIMGYYVYGYHNPDDAYWGTFEKSFLSLFILITAEGWTEVAKSLTSVYKNFGAYAFCISFLFTGHFIFGNLFVAVVIEQIDRATAGYEKMMDIKKSTVVSKKKQKARHVQENEIKSILNQMKCGDHQSFPRAVLDMYKHVRRDEFTTLSDIKGNELWVESVCQEYHRVVNFTHRIRLVHRELASCFGELLDRMDSSAIMMREERSALDKQVHDFERRNTVNFFRRISQNISFFGSRKISEHSSNSKTDIPIAHVDGKTDKNNWSCMGCLDECRCNIPEIEQRELQEETKNREERIYSQYTNNWLGSNSQSQRRSFIPNQSSNSFSSGNGSKRFRSAWN